MEYFLYTFEPPFQKAINALSLSSAILVLVFLSIIAYKFHDLFDRVSIKIQGILAIVDLIRHINTILYQNSDGIMCTISGAIFILGCPVYVFLNVAIALNVHLIGIRNVNPSFKIHAWILVTIFIAICILNIFSIALDVPGKDEQGNCLFKKDQNHKWLVNLIFLYLPTIPGMIYCGYVACALFIKYRSKSTKDFDFSKDFYPKDSRAGVSDFIRKLYLRIALLPLFCLLSLLFYVITNLRYEFFALRKDMISVLSRLGLRMAGTLNLIALVFDPYFQLAFRRIIYGRLSKEQLSDVERGSFELGNPEYHQYTCDSQDERIEEEKSLIRDRDYIKFF